MVTEFLVGKPKRKRYLRERICRSTTLKRISQKQRSKVCAVFIWLKTGTTADSYRCTRTVIVRSRSVYSWNYECTVKS
jgi:hypothetical protein